MVSPGAQPRLDPQQPCLDAQQPRPDAQQHRPPVTQQPCPAILQQGRPPVTQQPRPAIPQQGRPPVQQPSRTPAIAPPSAAPSSAAAPQQDAAIHGLRRDGLKRQVHEVQRSTADALLQGKRDASKKQASCTRRSTFLRRSKRPPNASSRTSSASLDGRSRRSRDSRAGQQCRRVRLQVKPLRTSRSIEAASSKHFKDVVKKAFMNLLGLTSLRASSLPVYSADGDDWPVSSNNPDQRLLRFEWQESESSETNGEGLAKVLGRVRANGKTAVPNAREDEAISLQPTKSASSYQPTSADLHFLLRWDRKA
ncbi:hypothetical protein C8T65DRAFT_699033 [Cerioporus squamosus]|nr:hypothetical protein C8T65DRAFT_699033 [Cerioporus squamosus]